MTNSATDQSDTRSEVGTVESSWTIKQVVVAGRREHYAVPNATSATRTDTPLIEVPQSVQVLTRSLILEQDRRTLGEALVNVSGVVSTRSEEQLLIAPLVRGFPAEVYLDGLPIYAGNQQAFDPTSLVGVERIDVLKGPSATLYGGGLGTPLGGVINIESGRPSDKAGGFVGVRGGSFSTRGSYGDVNMLLAPGIAARVAAEYQSNQSWIDQVHGRRWSVQPSVSFQIDPQTDLLLQGQFNHRGQLEYTGLPAQQALAGQIERNAFPGSPVAQPLSTNENRMGQALLRHSFSNDAKLTISGRFYKGAIRQYGSFVNPDLMPPDPVTPTIYPILPITMITDTKEGTLDANLLVKAETLGGSHAFLAGMDVDWTRFSSNMGLFVSNTPNGMIDLAKPVYDAIYTPQVPVNQPADRPLPDIGFLYAGSGDVRTAAPDRRVAIHAAQISGGEQYRGSQRGNLQQGLAEVRGNVRCCTWCRCFCRVCNCVSRGVRLRRRVGAQARDIPQCRGWCQIGLAQGRPVGNDRGFQPDARQCRDGRPG